MSPAKPTPPSRGALKTPPPLLLFLQWLLFTTFGVWAGLMLGSWLTPRLADSLDGNEDRLFAYVVLLSLGVALGVVQSVALNRVLPEAKGWLRYTLIGFVGAMLVLALAGLLGLGSAAGLEDDALLLVLMGAAIGLGQWALLRRHIASAWLWIPAIALGWLAFLLLVASPAADSNELAVRGAFYGLLGALPGGAALAWLSRRPVR